MLISYLYIRIYIIIPSTSLRHFFLLRGFYLRSGLIVNQSCTISYYNICHLSYLCFLLTIVVHNYFIFNVLYRLIIINTIHYGLPSTYYIKCLLLVYTFYYSSCLIAYAFHYSSQFIMLIMAHTFNIFIIYLLFCTKCIFNFCIAQSMLLSLFTLIWYVLFIFFYLYGY